MPEEINYLGLLELDRSKHVAVVYPPERGAHFFQDGFYFTHSGKLAPEMLDDNGKQRLLRLKNRKEAQAEASRARAKFMAERGLTEEDLKEDAVLDVIAAVESSEKPDGVDIVGWAKGRVKYPIFKVRKAMLDKYSFEGTDQKSIIDFLLKEGVINESDMTA